MSFSQKNLTKIWTPSTAHCRKQTEHAEWRYSENLAKIRTSQDFFHSSPQTSSHNGKRTKIATKHKNNTQGGISACWSSRCLKQLALTSDHFEANELFPLDRTGNAEQNVFNGRQCEVKLFQVRGAGQNYVRDHNNENCLFFSPSHQG